MFYRNLYRLATVRRLVLTAFLSTMRKSGIPMTLAALCLCAPGSLPAQTFTTLLSFDATEGSIPNALVQGTNGTFYGTTLHGGKLVDHHCGGSCCTIFSLAVDLGPFMETEPASGSVGAVVNILGTNLTGATSVSFNGAAATFTAVSSSEITTTVPAGATTGEVEVVTPGRQAFEQRAVRGGALV
jgi:hypothetical protein